MKLFDKQSAQLLERKVIKYEGPGFRLMARAALETWKIAKKHSPRKIWAIAGPGNNGGDAIMTACFALLDRYDVSCSVLGQPKGDALAALEFSKTIGLEIHKRLPNIKELKTGCDVLIDGVLGLGASRSPKGRLLGAINFINEVRAKKKVFVISIDLPSGLDPCSGQVLGQSAVKADETIMLLSPKQACYTGHASKHVGTLFFSDLGITNYHKYGTKTSELIKPNLFRIERIPKISHKGTNGSVLILGGWGNMQGAGFLAGLAAARTGVGKVFICTPNSKFRPMELIGIDSKLEDLKSCLKQVNVVVAGPGLNEKADEHLHLIWKSKLPLVLDAYGLRWLAQNNPPKRTTNWIGTPHHGETIELLGKYKTESNRFVQLTLLNEIYGGQWILKGPGTLVGPNPTYVNNFANGILATAGTGDVLAGIAGGMIAHGYSKAGALATHIHSESARKIIAQKSSRLIASDLLKNIGTVINELET